MNNGTSDNRPFAGLTVLDVSRILASPFTSSQLGFLGADVIKIEDPGTGDAARFGHSYNKEFRKSGMSTNFLSQNAGKRSLTLNLRTPEGQKIFKELGATRVTVMDFDTRRDCQEPGRLTRIEEAS